MTRRPMTAPRLLRQGLEVLIGALVMLHLFPLVTIAGAGMQSALNDVRLIEREDVRLSDVFGPMDPARDRVLGPAPQPGKDMILNVRTLMRLASAYQINWQPVTTADTIILRREGQVLDADAFKAALSEEFKRRGLRDPLDISFYSAVQPIVLPRESSPVLEVTRLSYTPGQSSFSALLTSVAAPQRPVQVAGTFERLVRIPVLKSALDKGTPVTASDLETLDIREGLLRSDILTDASSLIGLAPRRTLMPGRPLRAGELEQPLSLKRGDKVTLVYRSGTMELTAQGRALKDGRKGERVDFVNIDSRQTLQGTVTGNHRVLVD